MTETVSTRAKARGKGLKLERVFSTEGTHPYDAITWERRDVVQQNPTTSTRATCSVVEKSLRVVGAGAGSGVPE